MRKAKGFAALFIPLALFLAARAASAADGDAIAEVKVLSAETGAESIYAQSIIDKVMDRTRGVMNAAEIRKVLDEFYYAKAISDYDIIEEKAGPGRVNVVIQVKENIEVRSVKFIGAKDVKPEDAMRVVFTRVGQPLSEALVHKDAAAVEALYKERGYVFVSVATPREGYADGIVIFLVEEGPQVVIKEIKFNGNHFFSDKKLLTQISTRPRKFLGIFGKGVYSEEQLDNDVDRLANFYRSEGFLNVVVGVEKLEYSEDLSEMHVTIYIEEGQRFTVGAITFSGNRYFTEEELKNAMSLQEGGLFKITDYRRDIDLIRSMYASNAFIDVVVGRENREVTVIYHENEPVIDLHFEIVENNQVYVGNVTIRGNKVTQDKVLRHELSFKPMEKFNSDEVIASRNRLMRLGGFQDPYFKEVSIGVDPADKGRIVDGKLVRDVIVEVKESDSFGRIRFAAGFSSNQGLIGDVSIIRTNFDISDLPTSFKDMFVDRTAFLGAGQYFAISASPGTEFSRFSIDFSDPYVFDTPVSFGLSLFMWDWRRESYDESRAGVVMSLGRQLPKGWTASVRLRVQSVDIKGIDDDAPPDVVKVKGKNMIEGVRFSIAKDARKIDPLFKPYEGYESFLSVEPVFGDFSLVKLSFGSTRYRTVYITDEGLRHIIKVGAEVGLIFGDSPIYEREYLGGAGSMRGFDFRGVGPHQGDDPVGGNTLFFATAEYTFPLMGDTIRGVLFIDVGTVNSNAGSFGGMRAAAGFGLRIFNPQVPIPIAIDFGFPLMKQDGDDIQIVSFTIAIGY